jgi:hypothetical protein
LTATVATHINRKVQAQIQSNRPAPRKRMSTSTTKPTAICANRAITPLATNASSQLAMRQSSSHLDAADYPRPVAVHVAVLQVTPAHYARDTMEPVPTSERADRDGAMRGQTAFDGKCSARRVSDGKPCQRPAARGALSVPSTAVRPHRSRPPPNVGSTEPQMFWCRGFYVSPSVAKHPTTLCCKRSGMPLTAPAAP